MFIFCISINDMQRFVYLPLEIDFPNVWVYLCDSDSIIGAMIGNELVPNTAVAFSLSIWKLGLIGSSLQSKHAFKDKHGFQCGRGTFITFKIIIEMCSDAREGESAKLEFLAELRVA